MKKTPLGGLAATGVFVALFAAIFTSRFYHLPGPVPPVVPAVFVGVAVICGYLGVKVKSRREEGRIGLDRSQLNPVTAAQFLVVGKAAAWTGAIVGGYYAGRAAYQLAQASWLASAADELPGVAAAAATAIAMAGAGIYLERACEVPPPTEGETR